MTTWSDPCLLTPESTDQTDWRSRALFDLIRLNV